MTAKELQVLGVVGAALVAGDDVVHVKVLDLEVCGATGAVSGLLTVERWFVGAWEALTVPGRCAEG